MVHLDGVAKFVEEDIVDQVPGQEHQGEGEIDAASWRATSPMTFAVEDLYTRWYGRYGGGTLRSASLSHPSGADGRDVWQGL